MKKLFLVSIRTLFILLTITSNLTAQSNNGLASATIKNRAALTAYISENDAVENKAADVKVGTKEAKKELKAFKANVRATAHFKKSFINAPEAIWNVEKKVIVAAFTKDEVRTTVIYDKSGHLIHTLTYYQEPQTPNDVRAIVERDYPNGNINLTVKVKEDGTEFYIVNIEDKRTYKELAVYNGATGLIKQYNKNN